MRNVTEPIAAGVYFAPEAHQGYEAQGLDYFEGYFCSRSACLGAAPWSVVCAAFAAFKPAAVEAAVTSGWAKTTPAPMLAAREAGADRAARTARRRRRSIRPTSSGRPRSSSPAATASTRPGRALFAGLSILDRPTTPFGALWRAADLVREHRGDGHIAAWMPHVDSTEITVMTELAWGIPPRSYVFTRGWNEDEVDAAYARLTDAAWSPTARSPTRARELRSHIERTTDESTSAVIDRIGDDFDELIALLTPMAEAIVTGGGYPTSPKNLRVIRLSAATPYHRRHEPAMGPRTGAARSGPRRRVHRLERRRRRRERRGRLARARATARPSSPASTSRSTSTSRPSGPTVTLVDGVTPRPHVAGVLAARRRDPRRRARPRAASPAPSRTATGAASATR